jgi:hypothetical protein
LHQQLKFVPFHIASRKQPHHIMQAPSKKQSVKSGRGEVVILTANVKCAVEWYNHTSKLTKFQVIFEVFGKFYSLTLPPLFQILHNLAQILYGK